MKQQTPVRGLRFLHPDLDDLSGLQGAAGAAGLVCDPTGRLEWATGPALVRQSLLMLLSTTPGERVMRPDYGCELLSLAFAPADDTTCGLAKHYVQQAVERFEPRCRIVEITATCHGDHPGRLDVTLVYQPIGEASQSLVVGVPL